VQSSRLTPSPLESHVVRVHDRFPFLQIRKNGCQAHQPRASSSGSLAMFTAMHRTSSTVSQTKLEHPLPWLAQERVGLLHKYLVLRSIILGLRRL
jgi:hypothetical protein